MTITGELELTDSKTMKVIARQLTLTAIRAASLNGKRYTAGERIECIFPADTDLLAGHSTGPWGPGGFSGPWLKRHTTEINDLGREKSWHKKGVNFFISPTMKTEVRKIAKQQDSNLPAAARKAVEKWLREH